MFLEKPWILTNVQIVVCNYFHSSFIICFVYKNLDYKIVESFMVLYIFSANFPSAFVSQESRIVNGFDAGGPIPYQLSLTFSAGHNNITHKNLTELTNLEAESTDNTIRSSRAFLRN